MAIRAFSCTNIERFQLFLIRGGGAASYKKLKFLYLSYKEMP